MNNTKMVVNTDLEMFEYLQMVTDIALEYFNVDGKYQPHIGALNAMRIFYNSCVKESVYDEKFGHDIFDVTEMEEIIKDKDFMIAYNDALKVDSIGFDFGNAYTQALDIVEHKKASLENVIDTIYKAVMDFIDSFHATVDSDEVSKIVDIANKMSNNNINPGTIVEAYTQSERFHEVVTENDSENKK